MSKITKAKDKNDFVKFLTDNRAYIDYDDKIFSKEIKNQLVKIKVDDHLVYELHLAKQILIVANALYCTFNRDEYWGIAKLLGMEEIIADRQTLIRV